MTQVQSFGVSQFCLFCLWCPRFSHQFSQLLMETGEERETDRARGRDGVEIGGRLLSLCGSCVATAHEPHTSSPCLQPLAHPNRHVLHTHAHTNTHTSDVTNEPEASELVSPNWSTSRRSAYRGLYRFAEMTSLVTSEASFESSASQSGLFVHFWRDASTIRCPNSHLVFVVVVVSGWRFSDSWRFSGSWRFRLFGVVSSIDYLR